MTKYVIKDEKNDCYLISQWFGYSLVSLAQRLIREGNAMNIRHYTERMTDTKEIFQFLLNSMLFSSHYIEDSLFYIDYKKYSREQYRNKDKSEIMDYEEEDKKEIKERFPVFSSYLDESYIEEKTTLHSIPYLLDGKKLGFREVERTWFVFENGIKKEYTLSTKGLICYVYEDGSYTHIEPDIMNQGIENPHIEKERVDDPKLSVSDMFREAHNRMIEDALEIGILQKII